MPQKETLAMVFFFLIALLAIFGIVFAFASGLPLLTTGGIILAVIGSVLGIFLLTILMRFLDAIF